MKTLQYVLLLIIFDILYKISNQNVRVLTLSVPETNIAEFAKSVDLDEVAHNEPPHLELHCLLSCL